MLTQLHKDDATGKDKEIVLYKWCLSLDW